MTNIYRKTFYFVLFAISFSVVIATIVLGITLKNTPLTITLSFISFYMVNADLALWISTSTMRMTHTKLAWLLSFLVFPIISALIYLIWGRMPYYAKTVTDFKQEYKDYLKYYNSGYNESIPKDTFDLISKYIHGVRGSCTFSNNDIQVIQNNVDFYTNVLASIDQAKKTIMMCYYVIDNGQFWTSIKNHLIAKAKEGVKIFILFDRYGSKNKFTAKIIADLLQFDNIEIHKFESDRDIWTRSANNFRSHKKSLIIDNELVIYGGSNLADEYLSIRENSPNWNDLNFIIKGDVLRSFIIDYSIDWDFNSFLPYTWAIGDYLNCKKYLKFFFWCRFHTLAPSFRKKCFNAIKNRTNNHKLLGFLEKLDYFKTQSSSPYKNDNKAIFVQTGPRYYNNIVVDILLTAIMNTKTSIKIISPYIQLNESITTSLISAHKRGVDVEIITAGSCDDKWFLLDMNRSIYPQLLSSGIKIHEYYGFIHSKLFIIDDEYILSGTFNLDFRSFNSNFETMLVVKNYLTISEVIQYWQSCLKYSKSYTQYELFRYRNLRSIFIQTGLQIIQPLL